MSARASAKSIFLILFNVCQKGFPGMSSATKYLLEESQMPRAWYNIQADLPKALPPVLHPGTLQPVGPSDLAPLFPMELILQEVSQEREI